MLYLVTDATDFDNMDLDDAGDGMVDAEGMSFGIEEVEVDSERDSDDERAEDDQPEAQAETAPKAVAPARGRRRKAATTTEEKPVAAPLPPLALPFGPIPEVNISALYLKHRSHLLRFVQRYVGNQDDAEDVVQNTFVEAVRCAHRFSGLSKPSTWLFGIALNLARNHVRRSCADRYEMVDENFMDQIVDDHADPALLFELRQIAGKVEALLNDLPTKIRSTFEAVLDGEVTYEEAATQLSIPIGTVRSRVSRVRAAARAECDRN